MDLRHEIGELKSIHQAGVVGSKGGGTRGGYGTAMPASEFFKQGLYCFGSGLVALADACYGRDTVPLFDETFSQVGQIMT